MRRTSTSFLFSHAAIRLGALFLGAGPVLAGCQGPNAAALDLAVSEHGQVVVNEVFSSGSDPLTDPDWVELKNIGSSPVDLSGYRVRDEQTTAMLPAGTQIAAGAYLLIYCDDAPDGGARDRIHVPFKLGGQDEFYLLAPDGTSLDGVAWNSTLVSSGRSYGRLPDGIGQYLALTPTPGARNL